MAELSWKETERQLRARLAKYRQRRNENNDSGDSGDDSGSETKDRRHRRELNLPWGVGIDGGGDRDDSNDDYDHFDDEPHHGTSRGGGGGGGLCEKGAMVSSPSSMRRGGGGRGGAIGQTPSFSSASASRTAVHTNSAGWARYTMHVLDTEGIVRGLHSLRQNRSLDEQTREERLTQHYEAMLASRDMQVVAADGEAIKALKKYKLSLSKLQKLIRASQEHERSVRDANTRGSRAKEELAATREAMGAQSVMLSQRVMELEERGADASEMVDRLANNEARCVHCHGWNRIGRIIGRVGEDMKACLHCNRNPGFRSLNDEA